VSEGKPRLYIKVSSTLGFGERKSYINYDVCIWNSCDFLQTILKAKDQVSFMGEVTSISTYVKPENGKVYVTVGVNVQLGAFTLLSPKNDDTVAVSGNSNYSTDQFNIPF